VWRADVSVLQVKSAQIKEDEALCWKTRKLRATSRGGITVREGSGAISGWC